MKKRILLFLLLPILLICTALVAFLTLKETLRSTHSESFPVESFFKSPMNFEGNAYSVNAEVERQLKNEEGLGRIIVVRENKDNPPLCIFIPQGKSQNVNVGQRYHFDVIVKSGGEIYVESMRKF